MTRSDDMLLEIAQAWSSWRLAAFIAGVLGVTFMLGTGAGVLLTKLVF